MKEYTIKFDDLSDVLQVEIELDLEEEIKMALKAECTEYKETRADKKTTSGLLYSEAPWKDIAITEYSYQSDYDMEDSIKEQAENKAAMWKGVKVEI